MTHPTDEELDALVTRLDDMSDLSRDHAAGLLDLGHKVAVHQAADAITALRAQLAEAKADKERLGRELNLARYGQPDFSWQVHKEALAAANTRADRAEAALAAQNYHEYCPSMNPDDCGDCIYCGCSVSHPNHDRTALDRLLADAEAKALRRVIDLPHRIERLGGQNYAYVRVEEILALIDKPIMSGDDTRR